SGAARDLLARADAVRVVSIFSRRYRNAARLVAEQVGAQPRDEAVSPVGGNEPQVLVNQACRDIAAGDADVAVICGAEAWRTRKAGTADELGWTTQDESVPEARLTGPEVELNHPAELARQIYLPTQIYPMFEQALRHRAGRSVDDHLVHVSELWARFSEVAAGNPHASIREPWTAERIRTASPDNRWVVPVAGTDAHDPDAVPHRPALASPGAIRLAARRLFELAGRTVDDVAHVDLYSCFPSAVQIAAAEIGLGLDRRLTVTGGLSFAGGPWNNYVTHAIATMAGVLRDDPGALGLVTANGGYVTKHALGLYSTEPPAGGFRWADVQDEV